MPLWPIIFSLQACSKHDYWDNLTWLVFLSGNWTSFTYYSFTKLNISSLSQLLHWFAWFCIQSILVMRLPVILTSGLVLLCCSIVWGQLEAFKISESRNFRVFIFLLNLKLCWLRRVWVVVACYVSAWSLSASCLWGDLFSLQIAMFSFTQNLLGAKIRFAGFLYHV